MKQIIILCLLLSQFAAGRAQEQSRSFNDGYDDYGYYYYQPVWRWDAIRRTEYGRVLHPDTLAQKLHQQRPPYVICPWWYEDLYSRLPSDSIACIKRMGYVGYVLNPSTGGQLLANEWNNSNCVLDDTAYHSMPFDLVVYCRSGKDFDKFLGSERACLRFLQTVFTPVDGAVNRMHHGQRPAGIHFYLPEITFQEKRELIRFVKSVSMVIDAYEVNGVRPYENDKCLLTITFSPEAESEMNFISGLLEFTDAVYFARYNEYGFLEAPSRRVDRFSDPTSLFIRMRNQFYLLHLGVPEKHILEQGSSDFAELMQADYADYDWLIYFYIDVALIFILLLLILLYNIFSAFYIWVNGWREYIFPVMITLITEILILLLFMIESFSRYPLLFRMDTCEHYFLLALPLVFILVNILFKTLARDDKLP